MARNKFIICNLHSKSYYWQNNSRWVLIFILGAKARGWWMGQFFKRFLYKNSGRNKRAGATILNSRQRSYITIDHHDAAVAVFGAVGAADNDGPRMWSRGYNPHFSRFAKMTPRHLQFTQRAWLGECFTPCRAAQKFICEQMSRIMPPAAAGLMIKSSAASPRYPRILSIALIIARHIWRYALSVFIVRRLTAAARKPITRGVCLQSGNIHCHRFASRA